MTFIYLIFRPGNNKDMDQLRILNIYQSEIEAERDIEQTFHIEKFYESAQMSDVGDGDMLETSKDFNKYIPNMVSPIHQFNALFLLRSDKIMTLKKIHSLFKEFREIMV